MQRRQFISLIGGIATGMMSPLSSSAQEPNIRRIGVLVVGNADADAVTFQTELREELRKSGYVEGQNLIFDLKSAEQKLDQGTPTSPVPPGLNIAPPTTGALDHFTSIDFPGLPEAATDHGHPPGWLLGPI